MKLILKKYKKTILAPITTKNPSIMDQSIITFYYF